MGAPRKRSRLRRWLFGSAWATLAFVVFLAAAGLWLLGTASGARFALERALALAGGTVSGVEGRLVGPLSVGTLEITSVELRVRAERVSLDWSPLRLAGSEVLVQRLHAASLRIDTAASSEPAREPASLVLPVRLFVEQAGVDVLRVGTIGVDGGVELREVSAKLAADEAAWIVGNAQAETPLGRATASGTLGARRPFRLDARGELAGTRNGAAYRAGVEAKGLLAQFEATLAGSEGGLTGTGAASIGIFSADPVRKLALKLDGVDLAGFLAAPRTKLAVVVELAPEPGALLAGPVKIANADAGPVDRQRLPITAASAQLVIAKDRIEAKSLALSFTGGGRAEGRAAWSGGKLDAKLAVKDADLLVWHSALRATKLSGDVSAVASAETQSFRVALAEPRFEIRGEAAIANGVLTVESARLARGMAFAEAKGRLALGGAREFSVDGRVERLDPAEFADVPSGDLNAVFTASGRLAGNTAGEADVQVAKSRFAGLAAEGRVRFSAEGARITKAETDIALGATRLAASGALGKAGDVLAVKLASPDLAPLGKAFGVALGGSVAVDATVAGAFSALSGRVSVDAKDLALPGALRVAAAKGAFELSPGEAGSASGRLDLRGISRKGEKDAWVEKGSIVVEGTRASHEVRVAADFPERLGLRALFDGGLVAGARLPEWRGRLAFLESTGRAPLALAAPAALFVSTERIELGEARLIGDPGEVRIALLRWTPKGLETRGSVDAVDVRAVRRILDLQAAVGSNLVLDGAWDIRLAETLDGFVSLQRKSGDLRVGEPRQALGLETLAARVEAAAGRVKASLEMRGKQAGRWQAEASASVRRGAEGWELSPVAPLEGRFTVDVPELAWMAGWIGPEARAGGRLRGEGTLAGTVRDPTWRGRVEATGLKLREPALGGEVADGTIVVVLADREARLERFTLSAPWQPTAEAARAIAAAKRPAAGTITAEGALDLGTRKGRLAVKASGYPLTRLATRFLAVSGEGRAELDGDKTTLTGDFTADAGWFGIPASAPPSLSDDVIVERGAEAPLAKGAERLHLDLRFDLGEHLHFRGRGLDTRLAGSLRLVGDVGANLRTTGTIRAVGGTYDAYGRTLAIERGALNFQGAVDNPGLNVLALRKGLPVEAGVEVLGTVARPKVRLFSAPEVPEPEKLAWLVLGRGQGEVSAGDASILVGAANALLGSDLPASSKLLAGFGLDDVSMGRDASGALGTLPQSTVAGRTGETSTAEVVTVGKRLTDDIYVSYQQGLADAEGSLRVAWQLTRSLQIILRAGYLPGVDGVYRFSLD